MIIELLDGPVLAAWVAADVLRIAAETGQDFGSSNKPNMTSVRTEGQQSAFEKSMRDKGYRVEKEGARTSYFHPDNQKAAAFIEVAKDAKNPDKKNFYITNKHSDVNPAVIKDYMDAMNERNASGGRINIKNKSSRESKEIQGMLYLEAQAQNISYKGAISKSKLPDKVLEAANERLQAVYPPNHPAKGQKPTRRPGDEEERPFQFSPVPGSQSTNNSIKSGLQEKALEEWDKSWGKYQKKGNEFFHPSDLEKPAFARNGNTISVMSENPEVIADLVADAKTRKVNPMNMSFPPDHPIGAMLYAKAQAEDVATTGFTPSPAALAEAQKKLGITPQQQTASQTSAPSVPEVVPEPTRKKEESAPAIADEDEPLLPEHPVTAVSSDGKELPDDVHLAVNDLNKKLAQLEKKAATGKLEPGLLEAKKGEALKDFVAHLERLGYKVIVVNANDQKQALQPQAKGIQLQTDSQTQQKNLSEAITPPTQQRVNTPAYESFGTISGKDLEEGLKKKGYTQEGNDFFHPRDKGAVAFSKNENGGLDLRTENMAAIGDAITVAKAQAPEGIKVQNASEKVAKNFWHNSILHDSPVTVNGYTPDDAAIEKVCTSLAKRGDPKNDDRMVGLDGAKKGSDVRAGELLFKVNGEGFIREYPVPDQAKQPPQTKWSVKRVSSQDMEAAGMANLKPGDKTEKFKVGQTREQAQQEKLQAQNQHDQSPQKTGKGLGSGPGKGKGI